MIKFLKELYLTAYTLGYRSPGKAGGWQRLNRQVGIIMDQGKGVLLVSMILIFIFLGIMNFIEIRIGRKFSVDSTLNGALLVLADYYVNLYILITRGHGIRFEQEFNQLRKTRRVLLVTTCVVLMLAAFAFLLHVRDAYLRLPSG